MILKIYPGSKKKTVHLSKHSGDFQSSLMKDDLPSPGADD
jgi:hypothetical protein